MRFGESGDRGIPWLELGLEAVLVVVSVLLALGLDSWHERREHDAVAREALHALRAELVTNRKQVEDRLAYHRALADSLRADPNHKVTLRPAFVLTDAWESAEATGAVGYMDYGTASALGRVYALEGFYDDLTRSATQALYSTSLMGGRPEGHDRTQRDVWQPILADFISVESALTSQYDRTLDTIGERTREG
jgi:hypothetical protein